MYLEPTVFSKFKRCKGPIPPGFQLGFLGSLTNLSFMPAIAKERMQGPEVETGLIPYPRVSEEWYEWIDILESVLSAKDRFVMVNLGAGFGRWLVEGALAWDQISEGKPKLLVGVEAEPTHFDWLRQHLFNNGIRETEMHLVHAAVTDHEEGVHFSVGDPANWYGQHIVERPSSSHETAKIPSVTLCRILREIEHVNLLYMDIQGAEGEVLRQSISSIAEKVGRVHISTHSRDVENAIRKLFRDGHWICLADHACKSTETTVYGVMSFQDGVQSWINPSIRDSSIAEADTIDSLRSRVRALTDTRTLHISKLFASEPIDANMVIRMTDQEKVVAYAVEVERLSRALREAENGVQQLNDEIVALGRLLTGAGRKSLRHGLVSERGSLDSEIRLLREMRSWLENRKLLQFIMHVLG